VHQIKQVFHTPKFLVGFFIFVVVFVTALVYPLFAPVDPLFSVSKQSFTPPGTYVNIQDVVEAPDKRVLELDTASSRLANAVSEAEKDKMIAFLEKHKGVEPGTLTKDDMEGLIATWQSLYDPEERPQGMTRADRNELSRLNNRIISVFRQEGIVVARQGENGELVEDEANAFTGRDYVNVNDVANTFTFPLGSDNFGRDMLTQLLSAILVSLRLGLIAGTVATAIGLTLGLLAGYVGGVVDNAITFITNLFTVIPSFVLLVLISYSISQSSRGVSVVAVVIGVTAWPWTCRSVRSQVISLRNRDHVNLSKLSGHSMPRIILNDILPYVASYVVMAMILQISSAILSEAQLSMLGLGPSTTEVATLGLMMNWAQIFSAWQSGAWWAFIPVILSIAAISFSLNLMNTGLDQIFNPQLRDS
jgi:ABC-type dipeptide/oligopeptide/nickel transport system permease subunit